MPFAPLGNATGSKVSALHATLTTYWREPVQPPVPVAVKRKLAVPADVGVPVISPVVPFNVKPAGNAPCVTAKLYGATPPAAVTVWLYAKPNVPPDNVAGLTVIVARVPVISTL